jgi:hypothetical protein
LDKEEEIFFGTPVGINSIRIMVYAQDGGVLVLPKE